MTTAGRSSPVCSRCNDTHEMDWHDRKVMCTDCPVPCQDCRYGGNGAFCAMTPCECKCHGAQEAVPDHDRTLELNEQGVKLHKWRAERDDLRVELLEARQQLDIGLCTKLRERSELRERAEKAEAELAEARQQLDILRGQMDSVRAALFNGDTDNDT